MKTHPDFQSADPEIKNANDMDDNLCEALMYQYMFEKRTNPWEMSRFDYDELQKFEIDLEKVDRLYHIYHNSDECGRQFELIARMEQFYVELSANCDYTGFDCQGEGVIFISTDPLVFMKTILTGTRSVNKEALYELLEKDAISIRDEVNDDIIQHENFLYGKKAPSLSYLCHQTIYQHKDELKEHKELLPTRLKKGVTNFIKAKDGRIAYNE